uniref:Uridylate-specific endoribonuclease n=1 Tax=Callorhinchus milii TaxID=7868 RepID=A0A4W3HG84_CALMI
MKPAALLTLLLCSATARHVGYSELSCEGRCGESYNPNDLCHCNSKCSRYNNCCEDYTLICGEPITDAETRSVSERLYLKDVNKPTASELQINPQRLIDNSQTDGQVDYSPERFYSYVNEEVLFSRPTYAAFISLLNNYQWMTGEDEEFTPEQIMEQDNFLTAIMETPIMEELYSFLHSKKKYKTVEEFKEDLKKMWFGLYSRAYGAQDSSGFEHIFLGEVKKGIVSGFHNWIQFYLAEKRGELNYYSHNFNNPVRKNHRHHNNDDTGHFTGGVGGGGECLGPFNGGGARVREGGRESMNSGSLACEAPGRTFFFPAPSFKRVTHKKRNPNSPQ